MRASTLPKVKCGTDLAFGLFLLAAGLTALWLTSELRPGIAMRMGPGYVPRLLGWLSVGFGAVIATRGLLVEGPGLTAWAMRPLIAVSVAVFVFMGVERIGLVAAVVAVTLVACLGDRTTNWKHALVLAIGLAAFTGLTFVKALGLPMPLWPALGF
ncbi:tripartite tricarboxylate transporter TctB family protein [Bosea beijingensis]|uniref:tripartite tricarboxylate transporter TctB family protein n=1 Tax=Bosea beijingensis TaxID=3068632 RepID=UPI002741F65B|nr:tripartite tricarboxylate transporter TctB family protein [Bosea sp. REN20]